MGSKKKQPTPPPAPNPWEIMRSEAMFNRPDQFTPYGSLTWGGPNRNQMTMTLDPRLQGLFDQQLNLDNIMLTAASQALPGLQELINSPMSTEGLPELPSDLEAARRMSEQAFFDRSKYLLDEQFQLEEDRLQQRLANQGFQSDSEGYGADVGIFNQRRNNTFRDLANDAVLFGGQEMSNRLSDSLGLRNYLFNERGGIRGNQFNELASLLGLQQTQTPGLDSFYGPSQVNAIDAFGLQQQGLWNNFNTQSQIAGANKGAFADLLGTGIGAAIGGPWGAAAGSQASKAFQPAQNYGSYWNYGR